MMEEEQENVLDFKKFAVTAFLIKAKSNGGFDYKIKLDVISAYSVKDARGRYGIECKDLLPDYSLREVLAVEVVDD